MRLQFFSCIAFPGDKVKRTGIRSSSFPGDGWEKLCKWEQRYQRIFRVSTSQILSKSLSRH